MKRVVISIGSIIFLTCSLMAQGNVDSLKMAIKQEKDIPTRIDLMLQLCEKYRGPKLDSSFTYANKAIGLAKVIRDEDLVSKAEWYTAFYYYMTGRSDSALAIIQKNIDYLKNRPALQALLAQFYSSSGICFMKLDKKKEALDRFYIALQTAEKCDDASTQLKAYVNIGWVMMELNQHEQSIASLNKAIVFADSRKLSKNNFTVVYGNLAANYGVLNQLDSSEKYAKLARETAHNNGDISSEANALFILGSAQQKAGRLQDALKSFLEGHSLRLQEPKPDPFFIVSDLAELSILYSKLGNTKEGLAAAEEALQIAETKNITAKLPMIYSGLAANYEAAKDYEKASAIYKKVNDLKDSMYADANPKAVAEMQAKYETEKKERIIEHQRNRIAQQNILFIGLGLLLILLVWLGWALYKRYKLKKETQLQAEIMKQQELSAQAVIKAEEEERKRIARDLHDGVGQMMSAAKMNLSAIEAEIKFNSDQQKNSFEKIIELVDDSCKEVRFVSHNMMPNSLMKGSLGYALQDFVDKLDKNSLNIHLYTEGVNERVNSNIESVLYRVIQECVNNVIKHSNATNLDISVIRDKDGISATIEDNGKGFDVGDREKFDGIGLKNILTRVEYLKGTVEFDTAPGRGTAIGVHVTV